MSDSPFERIPNAVETPETFRQSLLTTMDACPFAGSLYVKGQPPGHHLYRGSVLHETFDRCIKTMTEHGHQKMAPDEVKAVLEEVLTDHMDWVVPASEMDGMRVMCHHWATHFELPAGAMSEVPYRMEVAGKVCTGTIDLVWVENGTCFVRDTKTGYHLYSQSEVSGKDPDTGVQRGAKSSQLLQYALGVADGVCEGFKLPRGVNHFDLAFVFPMFCTDDYGMAERGVLVTRPELIEHRTWMETLVKRASAAFEAQEFTAVPGSHCTRCPAPQSCPIPANAKGTGPFEQPARDVAEEWFRKKAEVDRLFKELKGFVQEMGPVEFGTDQVLELQQVVSSKTPKAVKDRVLAGEVVSPAELYQQSVSTRFGARKRA